MSKHILPFQSFFLFAKIEEELPQPLINLIQRKRYERKHQTTDILNSYTF